MKRKITVTTDEDYVYVNGKSASYHRDGNNGRSVYICGEYVVKIDDRGYEHDDMAAWRTIKREDRKYFVPCLAEGETENGDRYSIQPYIELDFEVTDEARRIVARLYDKYNLTDIDFERWDAPRNWAMYNGQPIIFDYGLGF